MSSKPHKIARYLSFGLYGVITDVIAGSFGTTTQYSHVKFKHDEKVLEKPYYKNKEVNMETLMNLIDKIKSEPEEQSIENQLYKNITGA